MKLLKHLSMAFFNTGMVVMIASILFAQVAKAEIRQIYVSDEKSNTLTVLDGNSYQVIHSIKTCKRPRGVHFSKDRKQFFVGCAEDNVIAVYNTANGNRIGRIRNIAEPETFDLTPMARYLLFLTKTMPPRRL